MNRELLTFPDLWFQINAEICARPRKSEKVTMKLNARSYWLALLLLMMSVVPAVAQFEVSPDPLMTIRPAAGKLLVPIP
jgi:hypothetical protein